MKVLVLGASGLIGDYLLTHVRERGWEAIGTSFSQREPGLVTLDLRDEGSLARLIEREKPSIIFQPAANANVEYCEEHPTETHEVNVVPVRTLVRLLRNTAIRYVYFSSDYVFDGKNGPYREEDTPNPQSEYARQKLECEKIILSDLPNALIIRTTGVYGWERQGKNFIVRLLQTLVRGGKVQTLTDLIGSPSYASDVAMATVELSEKAPNGIYHVSGPELMNRLDLSKIACEVFGLDPRLLVPVTTAELKLKATRPLKAGMVVAKAQSLISFPLRRPRQGLEAMKREQNPLSLLDPRTGKVILHPSWKP